MPTSVSILLRLHLYPERKSHSTQSVLQTDSPITPVMEAPSFRDNGVAVDSPYYIHREEKATQVLEHVAANGAVLIRAGCFSGKTSFVHSLRREAKKTYGDMICSFTALHLPPEVLFEQFRELVQFASSFPGSGKTITGEELDALCRPSSTSKPCLIIIDEAQVRLFDPAVVQPPSVIRF